jgi:hypothetical protein
MEAHVAGFNSLKLNTEWWRDQAIAGSSQPWMGAGHGSGRYLAHPTEAPEYGKADLPRSNESSRHKYGSGDP